MSCLLYFKYANIKVTKEKGLWVKMDIFDKEKYKKKLYYYYLNNYGKRDTDVWYASPAVNVWVFGRDDKIITIKSHLLTGEVTEYIE